MCVILKHAQVIQKWLLFIICNIVSFTHFLKLIFIGVWLLYNVVLASTAQQNESAVHTQISPPFWTPSHLGYHSALGRALCAIQLFPLIMPTKFEREIGEK